MLSSCHIWLYVQITWRVQVTGCCEECERWENPSKLINSLFTFPVCNPSPPFFVFACMHSFPQRRLNKPSPFAFISLWPWRAPWRQLPQHRLRTHVFDVRGVIREHAVRCRVSITLPVSRWILPPYGKSHASRGSAHRWGFGAHQRRHADERGWNPYCLFSNKTLNTYLIPNIERGLQQYREMFLMCVCVICCLGKKRSTTLPLFLSVYFHIYYGLSISDSLLS